MAAWRIRDPATTGWAIEAPTEQAAGTPPLPARWLRNAALAGLSAHPPGMAALHTPQHPSSNADIARALGTSATAGSAGSEASERTAQRVADTVAAHTAVPAGERSAVQYLQALLGHEPRGVRIHRDADAAGRAEVLQARAFTVGADIYVGRGEPGPGTPAGRGLLAHELTHVVQQQTSPALQRQEIPPELRSTPNYRSMSEDALKRRHEWILQVLAQFDVSTPETALLDHQISDIGTELVRRSALAAGRTFTDADIELARDYFVQNARTEKDSCIIALNKGLKLVTGQPTLSTTPKSIEDTMAKVAAAGYAGEAHEIWFRTAGGRITRGGARPDTLNESVWDALITMSGGDPGWSVFTMSLLDGYHSVTLALDASDPAKPHVYWSDQWQSKGGWKEYAPAALDTEVTRLIQGWWDDQEVGHKHTTVVRLWRIRATADTGP
jgi:Domain of unknown function (DUF4157)